jgi:uncharacterized protein (DUF433 family)
MLISEVISNHKGIYTLNEAAWYARLPVATLKRWIEISENNEHVFSSEYQKYCEGFISFLDFVQALAIRSIRNEKKVPLQKIREAVQLAEEKYNVKYPLARQHTTYLSGKEILIKLDGVDDLVTLSGKGKGQLNMKRIIEYYLEDISFDAVGVAVQYRPIPGILMDPKIRFGEPVVEGISITAQSLWEAVESEGNFKEVSKIFGVEESKVKLAYRFYDILERKPAA